MRCCVNSSPHLNRSQKGLKLSLLPMGRFLPYSSIHFQSLESASASLCHQSFLSSLLLSTLRGLLSSQRCSAPHSELFSTLARPFTAGSLQCLFSQHWLSLYTVLLSIRLVTTDMLVSDWLEPTYMSDWLTSNPENSKDPTLFALTPSRHEIQPVFGEDFIPIPPASNPYSPELGWEHHCLQIVTSLPPCERSGATPYQGWGTCGLEAMNGPLGPHVWLFD